MSTKTKEENARKQSDRRPRIRGAGRDREMQAAECCASGDGASRLCQLSDAKTRAVNVENSVRSGRQRDGLEATPAAQLARKPTLAGSRAASRTIGLSSPLKSRRRIKENAIRPLTNPSSARFINVFVKKRMLHRCDRLQMDRR